MKIKFSKEAKGADRVIFRLMREEAHDKDMREEAIQAAIVEYKKKTLNDDYLLYDLVIINSGDPDGQGQLMSKGQYAVVLYLSKDRYVPEIPETALDLDYSSFLDECLFVEHDASDSGRFHLYSFVLPASYLPNRSEDPAAVELTQRIKGFAKRYALAALEDHEAIAATVNSVDVVITGGTAFNSSIELLRDRCVELRVLLEV